MASATRSTRRLPTVLPLFVFDFDGVVCDSTDECMVTSWNAWERWNGRPGFRKAVADFSAAECEAFRAQRPRVRGAGEYYVLRRALEEKIAIRDQVSYDELILLWQDHVASFARLFFEMRDRLRHDNPVLWTGLHHVYREVIDVMAGLYRQGRLYIATLKDGESVRLILASHGLSLEEGRLLDESKIISKVQALDAIRVRVACEKADLILIDDNATHLLAPHAAGYPVLLAAWGATIPEYLSAAKKHKIPILKTQAAVKKMVLREIHPTKDMTRPS